MLLADHKHYAAIVIVKIWNKTLLKQEFHHFCIYKSKLV